MFIPPERSERSPLTVLKELEPEVPKLLVKPDLWQSLLVDYEPPIVERLWTQLPGNVRLFLHRIHPCEHAFYHPHPWPSAIKVVSGVYEMLVGCHDTFFTRDQGVAARLELPAGTYYEMNNSWGYHSVRPLGGSSLSLMVTLEPWLRPRTPDARPQKKLEPLTDALRRALVADFWRALKE